MSHPVIRGVIAPNLTPFRADLSVDRDTFVAHALHLLSHGCAGLAPFGTTGEALSVGMEERMELLEALVAAGADPARLIVGTGLTSLPDTALLTRHAVNLGAAGVMVLPPFYYKNVSEEGLFAHYAKLVEMVGSDDLRIYLYHIPQVSGVGLPVPLVKRLFDAFPGTVVGIKDSSGDWENTRALLGIDGLVVYPGSELPLLDALALGAPGCITATANLNAAAVDEVIRLHDAGRPDDAKAAMSHVKAFRLKVQELSPIPGQKRVLALMTGREDWAVVRPPLVACPAEIGRAGLDALRSIAEFSVPETVA